MVGLVPFANHFGDEDRTGKIFGEDRKHEIDPCCRCGEKRLELTLAGGSADLASEAQFVSDEVVSCYPDGFECGIVGEIENLVERAFDLP